ncbi:MAG: aldose 1-epimerase family protein [Anaerolineae bacterium]|nr:aldose 1-epimerase family protein [Anaerolineae bacterium]
MRLQGYDYTRAELLSKVGDVAQVGGVRLAELADGRERGVRIADVRTGTGFAFTVHVDRGLDIGTAEFCGQALAWRSAAGVAGPAYYEPEGTAWVKGFPGGLLTTCGFSAAGAPTVDEGQPLGLHGPISYAPAANVHAAGRWCGDEYEVSIQGRVREGYLFGPKLELERRIWTRLGESRLTVEDRVTNLGGERTPFMIIYHCNLGFPLLDEGAEIIAPSRQVIPSTEVARSGLERWSRMEAPQAGYAEQVFYHEMAAGASGWVTVVLANRRAGGGRGLGLYIRYRQRELPRFVEWKMMGHGDYVLGLEPANCWPGLGRAGERARGTLEFLEPGEEREFAVEIGVLADNAAIEAMAAQIRG